MADRPRNRILPPTPEAGDEGIDHGSEDKLFIQLLDDLDNISGGDQSIHRRRRAREIFSEWLFSQDVRNPQMMRMKAEQTSGRRHSGDTIVDDDGCRRQMRQQHSCDVEPFQREQSARRSCGGLRDGVQRRPASARRPRPSSYHYPSENDIDPGYCTGSRALLAASVVGRPPSEQTEKERNWLHLDLKRRIEAFNQNDQGLFMETSDDGCSFRGSIRIHMNLTNPISISAQPHFDFHRASDPEGPSQPSSASVTTSFCLPKNTTKVIRISNFDSTQEVIRALLTKFNITDNPRKFVLYEKIKIPGKKASMRQISDSEYPLVICLTWTDVGGTKTLATNKFILQENNSGESEILWKSFNLLELESFLSVLNREEAEHIDQVKTKYRKLKTEILKHLQMKRPSSTSSRRQAPLFL